jgi:hypothetical protein
MQAVLYEEQGNLYDRIRAISMSTINARTTVSINKATKFRIDQWRAYGQCYDGFLCELVDLWRKCIETVADMKQGRLIRECRPEF